MKYVIIIRFEEYGRLAPHNPETDIFLNQFGELTQNESESLLFDSWFEAHDYLGTVLELMTDHSADYTLLSVKIESITQDELDERN